MSTVRPGWLTMPRFCLCLMRLSPFAPHNFCMARVLFGLNEIPPGHHRPSFMCLYFTYFKLVICLCTPVFVQAGLSECVGVVWLEQDPPGAPLPLNHVSLLYLFAFAPLCLYKQGVVSALVLFGLNEILPGHHRWQFKAASSRWDLSACMLKV